jgi:hypothetical protein
VTTDRLPHTRPTVPLPRVSTIRATTQIADNPPILLNKVTVRLHLNMAMETQTSNSTANPVLRELLALRPTGDLDLP